MAFWARFLGYFIPAVVATAAVFIAFPAPTPAEIDDALKLAKPAAALTAGEKAAKETAGVCACQTCSADGLATKTCAALAALVAEAESRVKTANAAPAPPSGAKVRKLAIELTAFTLVALIVTIGLNVFLFNYLAGKPRGDRREMSEAILAILPWMGALLLLAVAVVLSYWPMTRLDAFASLLQSIRPATTMAAVPWPALWRGLFWIFLLSAAALFLNAVLAAWFAAEATREASTKYAGDDIKKSYAVRMGILQNAFLLASGVAAILLALIAKWNDAWLALSAPAAADDPATKTLAELSSGISIYWGAALTAVLLAIFIPAASRLVAVESLRNPDKGPMSFFDVFGSDVVKKVVAFAAAAAPTLLPQLLTGLFK